MHTYMRLLSETFLPPADGLMTSINFYIFTMSVYISELYIIIINFNRYRFSNHFRRAEICQF